MKPGDVERNLSRLTGLATRARNRLDAIDLKVSHLRAQLESGARQRSGSMSGSDPQQDSHVIEGANPTRAPAGVQAEVLFK